MKINIGFSWSHFNPISSLSVCAVTILALLLDLMEVLEVSGSGSEEISERYIKLLLASLATVNLPGSP